jgi:hypothetical protein
VTVLPVLLAVHVGLALALLLPAVLLPFALRAGAAPVDRPGSATRVLLAVEARSSALVALGLAASGVGLVAILGAQTLGQPWLLTALTIYAANLALAFFIQRPSLRDLIGIRGARDDSVWRARARRRRYVSYAMAGLTGTIGILMSAKPVLW